MVAMGEKLNADCREGNLRGRRINCKERERALPDEDIS